MSTKVALIIVDPQHDFCSPTGALYVPSGEEVIPEINRLRQALDELGVKDYFMSKDWHPSNHVSFVTNNPGATLFSEVTLPDGVKQVMWPVHCVQQGSGAMFSSDLIIKNDDIIIEKGCKSDTDSYSAFGSEDGVKEITPLHQHLLKAAVTHVIVVGLAFDYCVSYTAKDASKFGFKTCVVLSATRSVSDETRVKETNNLTRIGVKLLNSIEETVEWVRS